MEVVVDWVSTGGRRGGCGILESGGKLWEIEEGGLKTCKLTGSDNGRRGETWLEHGRACV